MKKPFIMILAIIFFALLLLLPIVESLHAVKQKPHQEQQKMEQRKKEKSLYELQPRKGHEMYRYERKQKPKKAAGRNGQDTIREGQ